MNKKTDSAQNNLAKPNETSDTSNSETPTKPDFAPNKTTQPGTPNQGLNRREFLKLSSLAASGSLAALFLDNALNSLNFISKTTNELLQPPKRAGTKPLLIAADASTPSILDPTTIPKFENQLTGPPPIYQPQVITSQDKVIREEYTVTMSSFQQQILPPSMNMLTTVWGYGGTATDAITGESLGFVQNSPGPTFEAVRGVPIKVTWKNNITTPYMFPVDPTIHWANPDNDPMPNSPFPTYPPGYPNAQTPVPLVTHLHGGENQSFSDGGPNAWFTQNGLHGPSYSTYEKTESNSAVYYYPNTQQPTTLWYHDHALGLTRLNVGSGLAGFYLLRAPENDPVQNMLPTGKYEMPIVIQDRTFNTDGSLYYPTTGVNPSLHPFWNNTSLGNAIVVNGKAWPNMNVDRAQYRFRILNGSNSRFYSLALSNAMSFTQIGTDGGYLKAPNQLTTFIIAPAERFDIIIDFSALSPGQTVILQNNSLISHTEASTLGQIMQFTVTDQTGPTPFNIANAPNPFNPTLTENTFPTLPNPTKQRTLTLYEIMEPNGATDQALLDGQNWAAPISETPELGTTEEWILVNPSLDSHPIHIHLVQFQLVQRQTFNTQAYTKDWLSLNGTPPFKQKTTNVQSLNPYLTGSPTQPRPNEQGWKDTLAVYSGEIATIRVRFKPQDNTDFPFDPAAGTGYVWHCHLLEHEDNEMMRPYKIIPPTTNAALPIIAGSAAVAAGAVTIAYYYLRKKKQDIP